MYKTGGWNTIKHRNRKVATLLFLGIISIFAVILLVIFIKKRSVDIEINHIIEITQTNISNRVFSLQVPNDWIGEIGYIIQKDPRGEEYPYEIKFIHLESNKALSGSNELEETKNVGVLSYIFWHAEYEPFYAFIQGEVFDWDEDKKAAPVPYTILQMNENKTAAYIMMFASDV